MHIGNFEKILSLHTNQSNNFFPLSPTYSAITTPINSPRSSLKSVSASAEHSTLSRHNARSILLHFAAWYLASLPSTRLSSSLGASSISDTKSICLARARRESSERGQRRERRRSADKLRRENIDLRRRSGPNFFSGLPFVFQAKAPALEVGILRVHPWTSPVVCLFFHPLSLFFFSLCLSFHLVSRLDVGSGVLTDCQNIFHLYCHLAVFRSCFLSSVLSKDCSLVSDTRGSPRERERDPPARIVASLLSFLHQAFSSSSVCTFETL